MRHCRRIFWYGVGFSILRRQLVGQYVVCKSTNKRRVHVPRVYTLAFFLMTALIEHSYHQPPMTRYNLLLYSP